MSAFASEAADELFDKIPALNALAGYDRTKWQDEIETLLDFVAARFCVGDIGDDC